ncbi:MAG: hypothetical protein JXB48_08795 [Candidatus Latescibacteria bacterium]|nr:hypothetical protein [Candidatus Latescibacterota bacterium]
MKKISIFMAPIIILAIIYGCSKDHDAPTFAQYQNTSEPTNVIATYNKSSDEIMVSWEMVNNEDVVDYLVAWSDSNVFDEGNKGEEYVKKPGDAVLNTNISFKVENVLKSMEYFRSEYYQEGNAAYIDSFIVYFTVSAVYNSDEFNNFIGPRAMVDETGEYADSALVLK